jgi:hypothetical protein
LNADDVVVDGNGSRTMRARGAQHQKQDPRSANAPQHVDYDIPMCPESWKSALLPALRALNVPFLLSCLLVRRDRVS